MIKDFPLKIENAIKNSHYSQKEIARLLDISESNITNWKKGENLPSLDILYKLCIILDESADYLLGLDDKKTTTKIKNNINNLTNNGKITFK